MATKITRPTRRPVAGTVQQARSVPSTGLLRTALPGMIVLSAVVLSPVPVRADSHDIDPSKKFPSHQSADRQGAEKSQPVGQSHRRRETDMTPSARKLARDIDRLRAQLKQRQHDLAVSQRNLRAAVALARAHTRLMTRRASSIISLTGLSMDRWLLQVAPDRWRMSRGMVRSGIAGGGQNPALKALARELRRHKRLQMALRAMPLAAPLDHYRKSSKFGFRVHPLLKQWAMHNGVDLADATGAAIRATAAGHVAFAGHRSGYGKVIEIAHGYGLRTLYAHCDKLFVKTGDTVRFRQKIAEVGTTGWTSGPHVHYEILVDGQPVDPMRFITAGRYALKPVPKRFVVAVKTTDRLAKKRRRITAKLLPGGRSRAHRRMLKRRQSRYATSRGRRQAASRRNADKSSTAAVTTRRLSAATYRRYVAFRRRLEARRKRSSP